MPSPPPSAFDNPWTVLKSDLKYDNPWVRVVEHQVLTPAGQPGIYGTVSFKNLAVGVLPIAADGTTYLVGQYRFPLGRYSWEIPEGGGKPGATPLETGQRELAEETGLLAADWQELLQADLSNCVSDERAWLFLAWNLTEGPPSPDDSEQLHVRRLPFREALDMAWRGEITDVMSVVALQRLELMLLRGEAPPAVAAALAG